MSLYNDKINKVRTLIIEECTKKIEENFGELDMWLSFEDWEFPTIYKKEFDKEFSQYISQDSDTKTCIYYAGTNLTYFVSTITSITKDFKKIRKLVNEYITTQIEDFDNVCDYISMTMYHEDNPDTDAPTAPQIVNDDPSST